MWWAPRLAPCKSRSADTEQNQQLRCSPIRNLTKRRKKELSRFLQSYINKGNAQLKPSGKVKKHPDATDGATTRSLGKWDLDGMGGFCKHGRALNLTIGGDQGIIKIIYKYAQEKGAPSPKFSASCQGTILVPANYPAVAAVSYCTAKRLSPPTRTYKFPDIHFWPDQEHMKATKRCL